MIPIIMQQILIDLDTKTISSQLITKNNSTEGPIPLHTIDLNEVKQFWNDYLCAIPNDLELIWDTLVNGQLRYLQVCFYYYIVSLLRSINYYLFFRFYSDIEK